MRPIKNKRRRDPRYFLHESADPDSDADDAAELRNMAADLEGGGAPEEDRDAVRMLLQHTYNVPAEQVDAMVDTLQQLGGEHWRAAAEEGQITDEAQQAIGLEMKTPLPQHGPKDPRATRMRVATSGWQKDMVAPGGYDPTGKNWKD